MGFTAFSDATVADYKFGLVGDLFPGDSKNSGAVFYFRSADHKAVANFSAAGNDGISLYDGKYGAGNPSGSTSPSFLSTSHNVSELTYSQPDAITDGFVSLQGVRTTDATSGQWTTPDAYEGDIHDPMSQVKYMWNNNNPIAYADPSGYDTIVLYDTQYQVAGAPVGHAAIFVTDDGIHGMYLCQCGSTAGGAHGPADVQGGMTTLSSLERGSGGADARYDAGTVYHTTDNQQAKLISDFESTAGKGYDGLSNNCVQVCEKALHDQGVSTGTSGLGNLIPNVAASQTGAVPLTQIQVSSTPPPRQE